jgi:hypothetical protein
MRIAIVAIPERRPSVETTSFQVEPGGYRALVARFSSGWAGSLMS